MPSPRVSRLPGSLGRRSAASSRCSRRTPWLDVLHDDRDAAVGSIERDRFVAQALVRETAHLRDLIGAQPRLLHQAASGVGAVGGKFPVAVVCSLRNRASRRCGLRPKCDLGTLPEFRGQKVSISLPLWLSAELPLSKNVPFSDSSNSMRRPSAVTVISIFLRRFSRLLMLLNAFLQLLFEFRHVLLGQLRNFRRAPVRLRANFLGGAGRIFEIAADCNLKLLAAVHEPQHDEERHHGGDEIGIGYLPRATVMAAVAAFFLDDDDGVGWMLFRTAGPTASAPLLRRAAGGLAASCPPPRQACSTSLNDGRTCPGTTRRPISTAMMGATPLRKEIITTRSTCKNACSSSAAFPMRAATGPTRP